MSIGVVIAERYPLIREILISCFLGVQEIDVLGQTGSDEEAIALAKKVLPQVVLLGETNEIGREQLIHILKRDVPKVEILILAKSFEGAEILSIVRAGARGIVFWENDIAALVDSVRSVADGKTNFAPEVAQAIFVALQNGSDLEENAFLAKKQDLFTGREKHILFCLSKGMANREIGDYLHISENTVRTHVRYCIRKAKVNNRTQLAVFAVKHGYGIEPAAEAVGVGA